MLTRLGFPPVGRHRAFVSALVAPVGYAVLLDGGALTAWAGPLLLCGAWALCVLRLRSVLPRAGTRVTNAADDVAAAG